MTEKPTQNEAPSPAFIALIETIIQENLESLKKLARY